MEPAGSGATWTGSPKGVFAGRKHHKPRQGVVANRLSSFRNGASLLANPFGVGFIDWLGFCAWLLDESVVIGTIAVKRLASALRATLHIAAEDVQLAFRDAAVVARLSICSPVVFLVAVSNALKDSAADSECCGNSIFSHSARIDLTRQR